MSDLINATEVHETFLDCLFKDEELIDGKPIIEPVIAEGLMTKAGLHPERVAKAKEKVATWLGNLDPVFKQGMTFLNMCNDRNGDQWGEHPTMDELVMLGLATDTLFYCAPREMWSVLPGGVPYVQVR